MGRKTRASRMGASPAEIRYSAIDVNVGMAFSNLVMYFIILASALTLFKAGKTDIKTAADAAEALRPLAGDLASILLTAGLSRGAILPVPLPTATPAYAAASGNACRAGAPPP